MTETEVVRYITESFDGVDIQESGGNLFFFVGEDRMMPFATLVTNDDYEQVSNLSRPGVFRLNVGVGKETYRSLFGEPSTGGVAQTGHDYTALDRLMPHPVYAPQRWMCVLNPSEATMKAMQPLLAEANAMAVAREGKRQQRPAK
jgi:hypothetical protein